MREQLATVKDHEGSWESRALDVPRISSSEEIKKYASTHKHQGDSMTPPSSDLFAVGFHHDGINRQVNSQVMNQTKQYWEGIAIWL